MWALVLLKLVLSILASWLSISANYSLVLLLWQSFDCKWVEEVDLLAIKLIIGLVAGAFSQLGSLSTETILGTETGKAV